MELNGIDRCLECMQDKGGAAICPHCGTSEPLAPRPLPYLAYGTRLNDQFVVGRMLGHGGFGVTYLAWDTRLETRVAIKEYLPRDFSTRSADGLSVSCFQGEATEMFAYGKGKFLEEARNLARFPEHPGIVKVLGYFEANGTAYMVMPYLEGMDLKQFLTQAGGRLPVETALGIMTPVLDALRAVHEVGLLHRDMSPDNIYITQSQRVMILDFGAARDAMGSHSRSLALIRKPGYSPAEQYRLRGEQGPWTDVYAVAATLYRMLTGETPPEALDRMLDDELQPLSRFGVAIDPGREAALMKALAVPVGERFQSIAAFQQALLGGAQPAPALHRVAPSAERRTALYRGARIWVPVLVVLVGLLGWMALAYLPSPSEIAPEPARADRAPDPGGSADTDLQAARRAAVAAEAERVRIERERLAEEQRLQEMREQAQREADHLEEIRRQRIAEAQRADQERERAAEAQRLRQVELTASARQAIGQRIWENEVGSNEKYLIVWHPGENHASVGIGHFLWYPAGRIQTRTETFPALLEVIRQQGYSLPQWLQGDPDCPWGSRDELQAAKRANDSTYRALKRLLVETVPIQVDFLVARLTEALPTLLEDIEDPGRRRHIATQLQRVQTDGDGSLSAAGVFALIDYVNFKGEGTNPAERYRRQGWGLLQVLAEMEGTGPGGVADFVAAAKRVLGRRITNAPAEKNEERWRKGWYARLDRYLQ